MTVKGSFNLEVKNMPEEEKNTNVSGVNEDTYASMLADAIKSKDAEIAALREAQADRLKSSPT